MERNTYALIKNVAVRTSDIMNSIATVWIFCMMLLMAGDVFGRLLFNHPIQGTPEIIKVSLVAIVFLEIPNTLWMNRHIKSDMILSRIGSRARLLYENVLFTISAILFIGIIYAGWDLMVTAWQLSEFEGAGVVRVPVAPIRTIIVLGSVLAVFLYLLKIIDNIKELRVLSGKD